MPGILDSSGLSTFKSSGSDKNDRPQLDQTRSPDVPARDVELQEKPQANADVLGQATGNVEKYKNVSFLQCGFLLVAETISLGILTLPSTVATVGWIPGMLLIIVFGLISSYTGYVLFQLKIRHMKLYSFADAAHLVFGMPGRYIVEALQVLVFVFLMSAHILTFGVMMNVLTEHGACTIIFTVVGTIVSFFCTLRRTLRHMSYLSITSCLSILAAVIVTMVGVGRRVTGDKVVQTYAVTPSELTSIQAGAMAVANIVVAYTAQLTFFGFISELRKPQEFPRSLALLQVCCITLYCIIAAVIYHYAGQDVQSPALNSAPPLFRKVAFGIALPTIIVAGVINAHVCAKNLYVHVYKKTPELLSQRGRPYMTWLLITFVLWVAAWIIAEAIPNFGQLVGLIGALFCTWFTLGLPTIFWFWMHRADLLGPRIGNGKARGPRSRSIKFWALFAVNALILGISLGVCVVGTYGSVADIIKAKGGNVFSCRDNSG